MTEPHDEYKFQQQCTDMVYRETFACVSNLVHTLAKSYGSVGREVRDLEDLCEQAWELARPLDDWQGAAEYEGWEVKPVPGQDEDDDPLFHGEKDEDGTLRTTDEDWSSEDEAWEGICRAEDIDPYETEIYEHWVVSDWLAARLEEQGERIDRDFAGLTVWARTTTGQSISMDHVIRVITKAMHEAV